MNFTDLEFILWEDRLFFFLSETAHTQSIFFETFISSVVRTYNYEDVDDYFSMHTDYLLCDFEAFQVL